MMAHPLLLCECSAANMTVLLRKDVIAYYGLEDKYDTLLTSSMRHPVSFEIKG